jgi:hypothetical protein
LRIPDEAARSAAMQHFIEDLKRVATHLSS